MAPFKFLSLTSASLFLLQGTYTRAAQDSGSGAQKNFKTIDCLASINDARALVGFAAFKAAGEDKTNGLAALLEKNDSDSLRTKLCSAVKSTGGGTVVDTGDTSRGIAYQGQTGAEGDCAAAVTSFKGGISALGSEKPGKYQKDVAPFNVGSAVSFASIFYPKDDGEVECAYVTCEASASGTGGDVKTSADTSSGSGDAAATKNALVCLTKPATLVVGQEPFSDEQFKALQKLAGSGVNSMPTFLALVAAAAGVILL